MIILMIIMMITIMMIMEPNPLSRCIIRLVAIFSRVPAARAARDDLELHLNPGPGYKKQNTSFKKQI